MDETFSLWALFTGSFLAATLLPGGSEAVLFGVLKLHPQLWWTALGVATAGNTLGGMSSYLIGRLLPQKQEIKGIAQMDADFWIKIFDKCHYRFFGYWVYHITVGISRYYKRGRFHSSTVVNVA
jgi:membrane protein YqaA with SNARE-associated domain